MIEKVIFKSLFMQSKKFKNYIIFLWLLICLVACKSIKNFSLYPINEFFPIENIGSDVVISLKKGKYVTKDYIQIENINNLVINGNGSTLTMSQLPNYNNPAILKFFKCNNITLLNLTIIGLNENLGEKSLLHNIFIYNCKNIKFNNINCLNASGDGIQIASDASQINEYSRNIVIDNFTIDQCKRNGISIINALDVKIKNGTIRNTRGHSPQAGIDIEPDFDQYRPGVSHILLENLIIEKNGGSGIAIPYIGCSNNITISKCSFIENDVGVYNCGLNVKILGSLFDNNKSCGIIAIRYPEFNIPIDSTIIRNNRLIGNPKGIYYKGSYGEIVGNDISKTSEEGMELAGLTGYDQTVIVSNNFIKGIKGNFGLVNNFSKFTFTNNNFENISGMSAIALYNGKGIISGNKLDSIKGIGIIVYDAIVEIKDNQFHHVFEEKIKIFEGNFGNTSAIVSNNQVFMNDGDKTNVFWDLNKKSTAKDNLFVSKEQKQKSLMYLVGFKYLINNRID